MKRFIFATLFVLALNVQAKGVIAEVQNEGGGSIALTDMKCTTVKDTLIAYAYTKNGQSLLGCWATDDTRVFIKWSDGDLRSYPIDVFKLPKKSSKEYL